MSQCFVNKYSSKVNLGIDKTKNNIFYRLGMTLSKIAKIDLTEKKTQKNKHPKTFKKRGTS